MGGWGSTGWGSGGWGGFAPSEGLQLVDAQPIRENVVRCFFNFAPYFSGVLDPFDGSDRRRYGVAPDPSTTGIDGLPPRPVAPAIPAVAALAGSAGKAIDLTVDRRFSPYPARYVVSVNGLRAASSGALLALGRTSFAFDGLAAGRIVPSRDGVVAGADFANPQGRLGLGDNVPIGASPVLGSYPTDSSGDYAVDRGLTSVRKRIVRRLSAKLNGFAHLAGYGLGALDRVKRLDRGGEAEALAAQAEAQIKEEPEIDQARVTVERSATNPELVVLRIRGRTRAGDSFDMGVPFPSG